MCLVRPRNPDSSGCHTSKRSLRRATRPGTPKPELEADAETAYAVRLTFTMQGHDQIEIFSMRASETEWTLITVDTNNPYVDGRAPLVPNTPELRQYRARYRDNDQPVGDWSDTVSATAQA